MNELNLPYALELALMHADDPQQGVEIAEANGIDRATFLRAVEALTHFPEPPTEPSHWIHALYFLDGWVRGYISMGDYPSIFQCEQLAHAHYRKPAD